ncbi:MAG: C-terminal binding protein [Bacteroidales bacterium]|nr:C-terminal binding protein [Bacteroidales bacterium]
MPQKIAILDTGYESYDYEKKLFKEAGYDLEIFTGERHDRAGKIALAKDAVGLLVRWTKINDDFLQATPKLKAIVRYGVGYDNIDLDAATRYGVKVANVRGYANHSVSDHALALIYACARGLSQGQKLVEQQFAKPPIREIIELHDKTLGIIGLGRIGGTLCQKAQPLFKKILASDPYISDERFSSLGASKTNLDDLLRDSDIISVHCNLTEETRGLIDKNKMQLMRKSAIIINTARGPVINEDDLYEALQSGKLHSVGLDVYGEEPPSSRQERLLFHPQVIATGHYAWYSTKSIVELQKRATHNLLTMLQGEIPEDCLNF